MSNGKHKQLKISFDDDWYYCYVRTAGDDVNITAMTNTNTNGDCGWSPLRLPHIIDNKERETTSETQQNWWYRKQFEWEVQHQSPDQQVYLIFESLNDHNNSDNNNNYSSIDNFTVWLNEIQIFTGSFQSPQISIELTQSLVYLEDLEENNRKNMLVVCCPDGSLSVHAHLLLPREIAHAVESEHDDIDMEKNHIMLPFQKFHVLDDLVSFNDVDGRFNIFFNSNLKSPNILDKQDPPDIIVTEDHDQIDERIVGNREYMKELKAPRLAIVMLVIGTRGDVQPFVAFGQALHAAGHRVRLATHEKFRDFVRQNGLEFYPLASNPDDLMAFVVKNGGIVPSMSSIMAGDVKHKRRDIADILVSTWRACTENDDETSAPFTAEVIIANPPSFGHVHCAQKLQIPLHMVFTMPWSATTAFPHAFCNVDYSNAAKEKLNLLTYSVMDTITWSGIHGLANDFRRDTLHLPPLHTRQAIRMMVDEQVPHTYCWSPSLVPRPNDWPPYINVAGYFFLNSNSDQFKPSDDLAAFLGLNNNNQNDEKLSPPIYIGFGSITGNDSQRLLQVIFGALERTGYRALLSGFDKDNDNLPDHIFKIGDTPHDWLFQHVSAVCHHGGAGTTAAGLRAGKPSIIVPFFGDQFFWGKVVEKVGAGPSPLPGKYVTVDKLAEAFKIAHKTEIRTAAEHIRDVLSHENGCATAVRLFHAHLPLSRMRSDFEPAFVACYRVDDFDLQVSRPVAQVLVAAGALDESQFRPHHIREWTSIYDDRVHLPTSGVLKHTQKAFSHIFIQTAGDMRRAVSNGDVFPGVVDGLGGAVKHIGKGMGHLSVGVFSLYGELTDVLDRVPSLYDRSSKLDVHERPRVTDLKSGAKAAGHSIVDGWKDGVTGFVRKPRVGYHRHGILGGATGALVATANGFVKPTAGSLASVTWLGRGMYASIKKKRKNGTSEEHSILNKLPARFSFSSSSSSDIDEQEQQQDNNDIPRFIKFAAVVSGYSTEICQQIVDEFDKVKKRHEEIAVFSPNQTQPHRYHHLFRRHRRHSDSAL